MGISGKYPGKGNGTSGFLTGLTSEENLPETVPFERWNLEQYYVPEARGDLSMYVRMASFVKKLEHFDATLFRLPTPPWPDILQHIVLLCAQYGATTYKLIRHNEQVYTSVHPQDHRILGHLKRAVQIQYSKPKICLPL